MEIKQNGKARDYMAKEHRGESKGCFALAAAQTALLTYSIIMLKLAFSGSLPSDVLFAFGNPVALLGLTGVSSVLVVCSVVEGMRKLTKAKLIKNPDKLSKDIEKARQKSNTKKLEKLLDLQQEIEFLENQFVISVLQGEIAQLTQENIQLQELLEKYEST